MFEPSLWAERVRIRPVDFRVIVQDPCVGTNLGLRFPLVLLTYSMGGVHLLQQENNVPRDVPLLPEQF